MSDSRAFHDVIDTGQYVFGVARQTGGRARVSLEPTFVAPETELARQYLTGRFRPPSLELFLRGARILASLGKTGVGLWDEDLKPLAVPSSSGIGASCDGHKPFCRHLGRFDRYETHWSLR